MLQARVLPTFEKQPITKINREAIQTFLAEKGAIQQKHTAQYAWSAESDARRGQGLRLDFGAIDAKESEFRVRRLESNATRVDR